MFYTRQDISSNIDGTRIAEQVKEMVEKIPFILHRLWQLLCVEFTFSP